MRTKQKKYLKYESFINWDSYKELIFKDIHYFTIMIVYIFAIFSIIISAKSLNFLELLGLYTLIQMLFFLVLYLVDIIFKKPYI